jgi:hypothetical protein
VMAVCVVSHTLFVLVGGFSGHVASNPRSQVNARFRTILEL